MVTDIEQARKNYMADYTPVDLTDAHKLLELAEKLQNEDISINTYELYKHPEAREKLFWQVAEEIDKSKTAVYIIRQKAIEHLANVG